MAIDIIMPQLGESIAEGTVIRWLIPAGQYVEKDQGLLEVESDKVSLEVPSPASGPLTEVLIQEGETVPVGTLLARLGTETGNGPSAPADGVKESPAKVTEATDEASDYYSPAVRQLAKERSVDLSQVVGTGAGGRVTKKDVLAFSEKNGNSKGVSPETTQTPSPVQTVGSADEILPLTSMRRTIAERMVNSRNTSAHVGTFFEVDFSAVEKVRKGRNLTSLSFVIRAVTHAIKQFPILNSSWSDGGIVIKHDINISVAVALEDGLLVPVIRNADKKELAQLGKEVADLAQRARSKQLSPEEVQGGTFTITNHGGMGSLFSTPIINQPQIAILGVGAIQKRPVVINDAIAIRPMSYLSLSFDHRVIDGATADNFMHKVKAVLEQEDWEKSQ
ncbi:MAG: dihydrolipoamide acetyltransferase family protein [Nitrospirota bacterium]|nr:dihydrolipoamide acetyltransferase family protein [Nitrospirota bacterium]